MRDRRMVIRLVCGCLIWFALAWPSPAGAVLIVDYVASATIDTNGQGLSGGNVPFSTASARSPALGTNSYNGSSPTFYGGVSEAGSGAIDQFLFETSDSSFRFRHSAASAGDSATGVYLWKKADFLNGFVTVGNVTLTNSDAISVHSRRFGSDFTDSEIRFVLQEGSVFYISDDLGQIPATYGTTSLGDPTAANWFAYNPLSSISSIGVSASPTFENLESIGVWFQLTGGSSGKRTIAFDSFMANATAAVPEPTSLPLAGLGAMFFICWSRHKFASRRHTKT